MKCPPKQEGNNMRRAVLALIICLSIPAGSLYAACKTEACKQATAWKNGYTAIILDDAITRSDYFAVLDAVKANQGVVAIEAERVLLGWLPVAKAGKLRAVRGVSAVLYDAVARPADFVRRDEALTALAFFNHVRTGEFEDTVEAGLATKGQPPTDCVKVRPNSTRAQVQSLRSVFVDAQRAETEESGIVHKSERGLPNGDDLIATPRLPGVIVPQWSFQTPYQNPDMRGRVTVQLFRLDSNGSIDSNNFTWTNTDFVNASYQVYGAFTFWVNQATAFGITLSFRVETEDPLNRYTRAVFPTPTKYEPIWHPNTDDYLWVNDALALQGYGSATVNYTNVYNQNDAFNRAKAADPAYGPFDRSFSVYIIYNPSPAPDHFTNGQGAYAYWDGPFLSALWNSLGEGPNNLGSVVTHETGHIFWACDEYSGSTCSCAICVNDNGAVAGPRPWANNANCANPNAQGCDNPLTTCVMKDSGATLCSHTRTQIGW
jgi:hypothetical protein